MLLVNQHLLRGDLLGSLVQVVERVVDGEGGSHADVSMRDPLVFCEGSVSSLYRVNGLSPILFIVFPILW